MNVNGFSPLIMYFIGILEIIIHNSTNTATNPYAIKLSTRNNVIINTNTAIILVLGSSLCTTDPVG